MVVAENTTASSLAPRRDIPEVWAVNGHCPACGAAPLQVRHLPDSPDFLLCPGCELSFEVAASGGAIRIKHLSEKLEFAESELRYRWVPPAALRDLLTQRARLLQEKATGPAPKPLADDEVWSRMVSLHQLGNKPKMIQFLLMQAGATQAQTDSALQRLLALKEQQARQQTRRLWLFTSLALLLVVVALGGIWGLALSGVNSQLAAGMADPSIQTNQPLPLQILKNLPDDVKPPFLKSPPAQAVPGGLAASKCPRFPHEAAALFGGNADHWQKEDRFQAWQMINPGNPVTLRIPAGMYVGYIDNVSFNFLSARGPVTLYNVNFVAVSCE